jgi:predicted DCC family thiol-disulfide oxidoreductase YuxK
MGIDRPILFYDGVCGLCNRLVQFVLLNDQQKIMQFAPLQGETAEGYVYCLPASIQSLNTIVYFYPLSGKVYTKSSAMVRVLWDMGGKWRFLSILLWCVPFLIRDLGYWFVAKIRYRLFGKKESCYIHPDLDHFLP